jgi:hypothetical protein
LGLPAGNEAVRDGDFKSYDEVVKMMEVVEAAILEKVKESAKLIIIFAPGREVWLNTLLRK